MTNYRIFMVDPPWPNKKGGLRSVRPKQGRKLSYRTMPVDRIFTFIDQKVLTQAEQPHCVFIWTVDNFLRTCEEEMERRGYKRHARLIWNKLNGVAPAFTIRYAHEYMLWYYKPSLPKIARHLRGKLLSVFEEKSREHSRKPDVAYQMINSLYPDANKVDVFSREKREGWEQIGDQLDFFDT